MAPLFIKFLSMRLGCLTASRTLTSLSQKLHTRRTLSIAASQGKMAPTQLVHYDSQTCPYAQRSWMTLVEKNIPFELRKVDLNNKSEDFVAVYQTISPDPDAPAKVPILLDGDTHLIESQIIVEYLATKYREIGTDILPADPAQLAKAKLFIDTFTNSVIAPFFALFRADTPEAVADGRTKLGAGLTVLDTCLRMHGSEEGGAFFLGEQFSIADVSTVPFLQRIMVSMPVFRGIDIEELMIENELDRLRKWSEAVLKRPSAIETKPADDVLVDSLRKFVVEMKTEE